MLMRADDQAVYMFALRYSLGRKTYAFGLVIGRILEQCERFRSWQLEMMAEEIEQYVDMNKGLDKNIGLEEWELNEYFVKAKILRRLSREVKEHERYIADNKPAGDV